MELHFLLLFLLQIAINVRAKVDIRQTTANKAFMETVRSSAYEVVHPFQIRDKNERIGIDTRNYFLKAQEHYTHVTIVIRSTQLGRLKLVLERNDFVFLNQTAFHKLDADGERVIPNRIENCYYQGTVGGEESSFVALSTCNGLKGVISYSNGTTFGLWPLDANDKNNKRHPHILYKTDWNQEAKCGSTLTHAAAQRMKRSVESHHKLRKHHHHLHKDKRDVSKRTKYIEVALIADYEFMKTRGLYDLDAIVYMLETINIADYMLSRDLNIRLSTVYVELWTDVQRIDLFEDIERTLSGVVDYAAGHIYHIQKDATILFTAGSFANSEVANAAMKSVCSGRSAIIVKSLDAFGTQWNGEVLAQSVGHLLGLGHDTTACSCEPSPQCIMRQQIGTPGSPFSWQFSKCSVARMHGIWQDGNIQCLLNKPFQASELRECGNGIVDGNEECDCGSRENCNDPCCDPLTCTLRPHAQCAAHHKCCHRCELKKAGEVCRTSKSPCDVAEQCDGLSGDCPADGHLIDGTVCGTDGQCWRGNCSDADAQCKSLWGKEAKVAETVCFEQNAKGAEYANCGGSDNDDYQPCQMEDLRCGTLHCQSGSMGPMNAALKAFTFHFLKDAHQVQCKSIASSQEGRILDGTSCGSGKVCVASSCVEIASVTAPVQCPTNNFALMCSGHGHCTTTAKCVCFNGWTGNACDSRSNTSKYTSSMGFDYNGHNEMFDGSNTHPKTIVIPHLNIGTSLETATMFAILLAVGMMLLMCLVCLMLCYRRKSVIEIPKASDEKTDDESQPDRQIKFGNMPSYREEKRKRKSTKRIYGALNRITEADERDSTSLRSRDSAGSQQLLQESRNPTVAHHVIRDPYAGEHIYAESAAGGLSARVYREMNLDGAFPLRSFGSWRSSGALSPASSSGRLTDVSTATTPLRLNKIGKILKDMRSDDESPFGDHPLLVSNSMLQHHHYSPNATVCQTTGEEELSAVEADHELASNTESSRGDIEPTDTTTWEPPVLINSCSPTSSNGASTGGYNFRQSPSLFSDPFKLEMTNSMHS